MNYDIEVSLDKHFNHSDFEPFTNAVVNKIRQGIVNTQDEMIKLNKLILDVDGLRGDIVTNRAAKAHAAYYGRTEVRVEDISTIITLCLRHRLRKDPLVSLDSGEKVDTIFKEVFEIFDYIQIE